MDSHSQITISSSHKDEEFVENSGGAAENTASYPHMLESAPFPALGSVPEITRILTRSTCASSKIIEGATVDGVNIGDNDDEKEKGDDGKKSSVLWEQPWPTEGWRNPGWLVVAASFLVNFVCFGNIFSWGNFQRLYLEEVYKGQTDQLRISFVGTTANACLLSVGVFLTPVIQKIGFRATMAIGAVVCPLGLILASFTTALWQLYLTQGILYGVGAAFVFSPSVTLPSQWFFKNRGLATGFAVSGSGVGGVALSPMTQALIASMGYRNALRILGSVSFGILAIATALARSRWRPPPSSNTGGRGLAAFFDRSMLTIPFGLLALFSFLVPFGYVAPFFLAPTYASSIGVSAAGGSALVSIMSGMNSLCRISLGFLADHTGRLNTMFVCTLLAGIFTMAVWQFAHTYGAFVAYCVLYGLTGGGFVSLFPVVTAEVVGVQHIQKGLSVCYFITMFGNLVGTPIIGQLQKTFDWTAAIQFAGAPSVAAALVMLLLRFLINKKLWAKV